MSRRIPRSLPVLTRALVGVAMLAGAAGLVALLARLGAPPEQHVAPAPPPVVRTMTVRPVPLAREWNGYGTARAMDAADLSAQVTARVVARPGQIEAGASVRAGDLIVQLERSDFAQRIAALEQGIAALQAQIDGLDVEYRRLSDQIELAQEEVDIDRAELERIITARASGAGSQTEEDQRRAALRRSERVLAALQQQAELIPSRRSALQAQRSADEANLRLAELDLERAAITAPFDGVLQSVSVDVGELVTAGQQVARIVDLARVEIPVRVAVSAGRAVGVGDDVELRPDGPRAPQWHGAITRIAPEADPATRTIALFVEVQQDPSADPGQELLHPGRFVVARIRSAQTAERLVVPRRVLNSDHLHVFEAEEPDADNGLILGVARRVPVRVDYHFDGLIPELDERETQWTVLGNGLHAGDLVIVSHLDEVRDEMRMAIAGQSGGGP